MVRFISGLPLPLPASLPVALGAVVVIACSSGSPSASTNDAVTTPVTTADPSTTLPGTSTPPVTSAVTPPAPTVVTPVTTPPAPSNGTIIVGETSSSPTTTVVTTSEPVDDTGAVVSTGDVVSESDATSVAVSDTSASGEATADTSAPVVPDGDMVPPRALNVTAAKARHEHNFRAKTADATVSYNDNDQIAVFDNRAATLMGKLVLTFGGAGETKGNLTESGKFCAQRGFHVLAIAAFQAYDIVSHGPEFYGLARRTVFEGVMHTKEDAFANITLTKADGVAQRTQKALQYLHATYPDEDWGYYLQEDGSVRWSDVIFTGMSHGASNSARFGSLVRVSRVVAVGGPRDNLCQRVDLNNCGGDVATWYDEEHATPIDRYYTITGVGDDQHTQHLFAMEKLGYTGEAVRVDSAQPPYNDSHRLVHPGGHDDLCTNQTYKNLCNYAFGVPTENQNGTGP